MVDTIFDDNTINEVLRNLIYKSIENAVVLHDIGKINPAFQKNKMSNSKYKFDYYEGINGDNHSFLSSIIYLSFQLEELNKALDLDIFTDNTRREQIKSILTCFALLNSYVIAKHHSDLDSLGDFLKKFSGSGEVEALKKRSGENTYPFKNFDLNAHLNSVSWKISRIYKKFVSKLKTKDKAIFDIYIRLVYSFLVTSDYYSTSEFMSNLKMNCFGAFTTLEDFKDCYQDTPMIKNIREYGKNRNLENVTEINRLRNEMFLEAESNLNLDSNIFFLEAPTGSGKSNMAMNLSFKLASSKKNKLFYVYPFNNLVEQNWMTLHETFGSNPQLISSITVINSLNPIKGFDENDLEYESKDYNRMLMDRQFMNYPFVLTTHVSFFDILFGNRKIDVFSFLQLINSVVVLDEIQSYKLDIWTEIIRFLHSYAKILNMKIIIMSATLPDLAILLEEQNNNDHVTGEKCSDIQYLINNRDKYFENPMFSDRVRTEYSLLNTEYNQEELANKILAEDKRSKILVEFIKKKSAYEFYNYLSDKASDRTILCMTGDDNVIARKKIINQIKNDHNGLILVATQVIEAGVDIDMDIGYKSISKLDSEEQFMGRINRSSQKENSVVHFFKNEKPQTIYKGDVRTDKELILLNDKPKEWLKRKDFKSYYNEVFSILKIKNQELNKSNVDSFFQEKVGLCDFIAIKERMKLIDDDLRTKPIFLNRTITDENNNKIIGEEVWEEYKNLIFNNEMDYAEKIIKLSNIKSKVQLFIYEIPIKWDIIGDILGEIIYVDNGEAFFKNGKLDLKQGEESQVCL